MIRIATWFLSYGESIGIWVEAVALLCIFIWDRCDAHREHRETLAQRELWRKQIHADSVREVWRALRNFEHFVVHSGKVVPQKQFTEDEPDPSSPHRVRVCQAYLDLQEAFYLSRLVSDGLFAFMKQRVAEADGLQRTPSQEALRQKLEEFHRNWDVYEMAAQIRELS